MLTVHQPSTGSARQILYRMFRSARLDGAMFRSLSEDGNATIQSVAALALSSFSFGLGFTVSIGVDLFGALLGAAVGIALGLIVGFVWLSLTYLVITKIFKGASSYWGLARPVFFASSPGLIFLLMIIPVSFVQDLARVVGIVWIAVSNVSAIKNSMGFDNQRSIVTFTIVAFILLLGYGLLASI